MLWEWPWLSRLQPQSSSPSEGWILLARMETPLSMRKWAMSSTRIAARISFRFFFNQPNFARGGDSLLTDHSCLDETLDRFVFSKEIMDWASPWLYCLQRWHQLGGRLLLKLRYDCTNFFFSSLTTQYDGSWRFNGYIFELSEIQNK